MKKILFILFIAFISCKSGGTKTADLQVLDLMQYGLPIKINAPADAKVTSDDLGFIKDVTVKGAGNYFIQLQGGDATTTDVKIVKDRFLAEIKQTDFFSKIVEESDQGFIYEKDLGKDNLNYDFRYIKLQGDKEYVFQRGLIGKFTLEEVKNMYQSIQ